MKGISNATPGSAGISDTVGELFQQIFSRLCRFDVRNGFAVPGSLSTSHPRLRRKIGGVAADDFHELPDGSKTHRTSERQSRLIPKPRLSSPTVSSLAACNSSTCAHRRNQSVRIAAPISLTSDELISPSTVEGVRTVRPT
jgi:hypothetical protein